MTESASAVLRERVARLDATPATTGSPVHAGLMHAVSVMQVYTNTEMEQRAGGPPVLDPDEADAVVARCGLVEELRVGAPAVVTGPLDTANQQWISTARSPDAAPDRQLFTGPPTDPARPAVKPADHGLFTSSASALGPSMWRLYLDPYYGSDLFPLPWSIWALPASGPVAEIGCAADWVAFVDRYPRRANGLVYPDWYAASADVAGVHVTLRAVVAIQGFVFPCAAGLTAPGYWDVETTCWLRWSFGEPRLLDIVR